MSTAYVSTIIEADIAEWYGEFDCDAALADELTGQFTRIYAAFLDEMRRHVAGAAT